MTTEKQTVKTILSIIECTDPMDVPNKTYKKMIAKATTDRTGEIAYNFTTYYPSVMEILKKSVGKSVECEVFLDERKIVSIRDETALLDRERAMQTQSVMRSVSDSMLSETIHIPDDVLKNHWEIVKRLQNEALK